MNNKYTYLSNKLSNEQIKEIKDNLTTLDFMPSLPINNQTSTFLDFNDEQLDFMQCLKKDIEESAKFISDCLFLISQENTTSNFIHNDGFNTNIKFEYYSLTIPNQIIDNNKKLIPHLKEELLNVLYFNISNLNIFTENESLEDFIRLYKYSISKPTFKNDVQKLLGEAPLKLTKIKLEKIFKDFFHEDLTLNVNSQTKINKITGNDSIATAFSDAKQTIIFPLSEETLKQYPIQKWPQINTLNELFIDKSYNQYIDKLEIHLVSKGYENKLFELNKHIDTLKHVFSSNLALNSSFVLRYRKLGKHKAEGLASISPSDNEISSIIIDPTSNHPSIIHELAHLIDIKNFKNSDIRNFIVNYFRKKLDFSNSKYPEKYTSYLKSSNEIVARLCEIGHDIKFPEQEEEIIRLCKSREFYENDDRYFDLKNLSEVEKNMIKDFYSLFFENTSNLDKEQLISNLNSKIKTHNVSDSNKSSKTRQAMSELLKEKSSLKKILRNYNPEVVAFLLEDIKKREKNGEELILSEEQIISYLFSLLSANHLNRFNNLKRLSASEDYPTMISENVEIFELLKDSINNLNTEQQLNMISIDSFSNDLRAIINSNTLLNRKGSNIDTIKRIAAKAISNISKYKEKQEYGLFSLLTNDSLSNLFSFNPEVSAQAFNNLLNKVIEKEKNNKLFEIMNSTCNTSSKENFQVKLTEQQLFEAFISSFNNNFPSSAIYNISKNIKSPDIYSIVYNLFSKIYSEKIKSTNIDMNLYENDDIKNIFDDLLKKIDFNNPNKMKDSIPFDTFITDIDLNLIEFFSSDEIIESLILTNNPFSKELLNNLLLNINPQDLIKKKYFSKLDTDIQLRTNNKLEYLIKIIIPKALEQKKFFLDNDFAEELVNETSDFHLNISKLPKARFILSLVKELYQEIEYLEEVKASSVDEFIGVFDEYGAFLEFSIEDIEKITTKKEKILEDLESNENIPLDVLSRLKSEIDSDFDSKITEKEKLTIMLKDKNIDGIISWYKEEINLLIENLGNHNISKSNSNKKITNPILKK